MPALRPELALPPGRDVGQLREVAHIDHGRRPLGWAVVQEIERHLAGPDRLAVVQAALDPNTRRASRTEAFPPAVVGASHFGGVARKHRAVSATHCDSNHYGRNVHRRAVDGEEESQLLDSRVEADPADEVLDDKCDEEAPQLPDAQVEVEPTDKVWVAFLVLDLRLEDTF